MNEQTIEMHSVIMVDSNSLSVDMDGEEVVMNMGSGEYFDINGIGSLIWGVIKQQETTVASLFAQLTECFCEDDPGQIKSDLFVFLAECRECGIIAIDSDDAS
ncbi:MAG: PqqD family protein [Gammaproteobacteria bacterium]|nr:PqqD family protein [Gammaproteobacteria bacterium]